MQTQTQSTEQYQQFCNYINIRKFHKQTFRDAKLNRHCAHVIRNGEPITLTKEQREWFIQSICDIPDNPIGLGTFCKMTAYVFIAMLLPMFPFALAYGFNQANKKIAYLLYAAGIILLLLVLAGFIWLCIRIKRKNISRADRFRAKAREKIIRGDYQSFAYRIEEIYRIKTYNDDMYGGYIYFWYRVGNVIFELPNTSFAYSFGTNNETIYKEPDKLKLNEYNHPVGGYIIGMLIRLDNKYRFYGI